MGQVRDGVSHVAALAAKTPIPLGPPPCWDPHPLGPALVPRLGSRCRWWGPNESVAPPVDSTARMGEMLCAAGVQGRGAVQGYSAEVQCRGTVQGCNAVQGCNPEHIPGITAVFRFQLEEKLWW